MAALHYACAAAECLLFCCNTAPVCSTGTSLAGGCASAAVRLLRWHCCRKLHIHVCPRHTVDPARYALSMPEVPALASCPQALVLTHQGAVLEG